MNRDNWVRERVKVLAPELIAIRRQIHQYPELGFEERETARYVANVLSGLPLEVSAGVAQTGVVAVLHGAGPGRTLALRADMDALPIQETTGLPYASAYPGIMHACGHDLHTASLLGTAMVLSALRKEWAGTVKFLFQPAEEGPGGAQVMVAEGVLDGVDAIVGAHIRQQLPTGQAGIRSGAVLACSDTFDITITGRGCHGAYPHSGVDAITAASQVVLALQTIVSRETSPLRPLVLTISSITGGQGSYNTLAEEVKLKGTVRTLNAEVRAAVPERMREIIAGVTGALRAGYEFCYHPGYPATINDPGMTEHAAQTLGRLLGAEQVVRMPEPIMAAEDMSYYLEKVPGVFFFVGSGSREPEKVTLSHQGNFEPDEAAIGIMTEVMSGIALDWLTK